MPFAKFITMTTPPGDNDLAEAPGKAKNIWDDIIEHLEQSYSDLFQEWKKSGKKYSWVIRLATKKKVVVYLIPESAYFQAAFILGPKAVEAVRGSDLPATVKDEVENAKQYAEGRPLRMNIKTAADLKLAKKISAVKMRS